MHDIRNNLVSLAEQQIAQSHRPHQLPPRVQHIADIAGLAVKPDGPDAFNRLIHREIPLQRNILYSHDTPRRVLRITQQLIDCPAGVRIGICKQALYHISRHLLQKVHGIVRHQIVDNAAGLPVCKRVDNKLLGIRLQIGKHVRSQILGQDAKHLQHALRLQFLHEKGDVRLVQIGQKLTEIRILFRVKKPDKFLQFDSCFHSISPYVVLSSGCNFDREEGYRYSFSDSSCKTTTFRNAFIFL